MADNPLLEEFKVENAGELQERLTEVFDRLLDEADDTAINAIKIELESVLKERIDAPK